MKNIFAVYKPKGPTSNDIVQKIKKITGEKKVGHAGTLDPLAGGVLVVGVGREATKKLSTIVKKEKEYLATIKLGENSITDDAEGEKTKVKIKKIPSAEEVKKAVYQIQGKVWQVPPVYSAVKVSGQEAYKLARKGKKVELKPRKVEIKKIRITSYSWPYLKLQIITGPGFYIRALARDIGANLDTGGYLADLERIRVGQYFKQEAIAMDNIFKYYINMV